MQQQTKQEYAKGREGKPSNLDRVCVWILHTLSWDLTLNHKLRSERNPWFVI